MKTKIEMGDYCVCVEEKDGFISVEALKDEEVVEEFSIEMTESEEGQDESQDEEEIQNFGEYGQDEEEGQDADEAEGEDDEEDEDDDDGTGIGVVYNYNMTYDPNKIFGVHLNLTGYLDGSQFKFAPFSHNADAPSTPAPEPGTMLLFGTGLIGLAWVGRRQLQGKKDS